MDQEPTPQEDLTQDDSEVQKIVDAVFLAAVTLKASDIHIDPVEDAEGHARLLVRYRVDGVLRPGEFKIPMIYRPALMTRIKLMTMAMDITERKLPQTARLKRRIGDADYEFRVEISPTYNGEACVMRTLDQRTTPLEAKDLGFLADTEARFLSLLQRFGGRGDSGLILVSGPHESGKTAALYACVNAIKRPDFKVITIESPAERPLHGVVQLNINAGYGPRPSGERPIPHDPQARLSHDGMRGRSFVRKASPALRILSRMATSNGSLTGSRVVFPFSSRFSRLGVFRY